MPRQEPKSASLSPFSKSQLWFTRIFSGYVWERTRKKKKTYGRKWAPTREKKEWEKKE
jgi:hypothetical protein